MSDEHTISNHIKALGGQGSGVARLRVVINDSQVTGL